MSMLDDRPHLRRTKRATPMAAAISQATGPSVRAPAHRTFDLAKIAAALALLAPLPASSFEPDIFPAPAC